MLSKFSVQKPYTVAVGVVLVLILGVISFMNMTTDLLPSMDLPYVVVYTSYVGASPEEVELVVTRPLESALATVNDLKNVTSVSRENASQVILEFNDGANMDAALIDLSAKIDLIKPNWNDSVGAPIVMKLNPDMLPVMIAAVDEEDLEGQALSDYVSDTLAPALEAVNGVASVDAYGLIEQTVEVAISQPLIDKLNTAILEEVDAELAKVERQLNDGEQQLREAKAKLSSEGGAARKQMKEALKKIREAMAQLPAMIEKAKAQRAELVAQLEELRVSEAQLQALIAQLPVIMTDAQRAALAEYRRQLEELNAEKAAAEQELARLDADSTLSPIHTSDEGTLALFRASVAYAEGMQDHGEMQKRRQALRQKIAKLQKSIDKIENAEEYQTLLALEREDAQGTELHAQLAQVQSAIQQLQAGIAQIDATIAKLENGTIPGGIVEGIDADTNLPEQEAALLAAMEQLDGALSGARSKISEAQAELGEKRKEFEDAREDAFKEAKLDGVVTVQMVSQMLGAQNFQMPAGYITEDDQDYLVRVGDKFNRVDGMAEMLLFNLDLDSVQEVYLKDVANVVLTDNSADSYTKINGRDGIMLSFSKQSTFSTADVAGRLKEKFAELEETNAKLHVAPLFDQGIYIDMIVRSVLENLAYGGILAILVLLIFLGDYRPTLVIGFSIPLSVVAAFVAMYFSGMTLNVISLAGLALGVGMLVDNSIVVIENIYRLYNEGMKPLEACVTGAKQMAGAIFSSTLTTVCVFLPIVFIQGLARQLFSDMGLTIAYSLLASLVVALTVVPAMSSALLKKQKERKHRLFTALQKGYAALLRGALRVKFIPLAASVALLAFSVVQIGSMGTAFMSDVDSTQMTATLVPPTDMKPSEQYALADEIMARLLRYEDVDTVGVFTGGAAASLMSSGGGSGGSLNFYLNMKEEKSMRNEEIAPLMLKDMADLPGEFTIQTNTMDISMLYGTGIQVNVKGAEIDVLRSLTSQVAEIMRAVPGTMDVSDGQEKTVPELRITVDKAAAIAEGLTVAQIYQFVAGLISDGVEVTTLTAADKDYPVLVVDDENRRLTREELVEQTIEVTKADEINEIRLGDICDIAETDSLSSISREAQQRMMTASCTVDAQHNIGLVSDELTKALAGLTVPSGYTVEMSGESEAIDSTLGDLLSMIALAIVFIYLIMVAQFQSLLSPFIVLFTIPLAFTGGLLALYFARMEVSLIAMLGFLMLSGVVVNNGIVFVDSVNQMRLEGMGKREALIETGRVRLRPILMTALTTILGMFTIAIGSGMGSEMMQPMAVVTMGGLSYATLMTLFIVPVLYDAFHRREMRDRRMQDAPDPTPEEPSLERAP